MIRAKLKRLLTLHPALTFLLMMACAITFGLLSFNLFFYAQANIRLVSEYGAQALEEGALEEFIHLFSYGVLSLVFYLLFKACEKTLVDWIVK